jgi:hypothetical protein
MPLLAGAAMLPALRDAEGRLTGLVALPAAVLVAGVLCALAWRGGWRRSAGWFALWLVGYAAQLQLIEAGKTARYQHLAIGLGGWGERWPFAAFLGVQAVLVGWGLRNRWGAIAARCGARVRGGPIAAFFLLAVLSSATLSRNLSAYLAELAVAPLLQGLSLATLVLAVGELPERVLDRLSERLERLLGSGAPGGGPEPGGVDRFALALAGLAAALAAVLAVASYQAHPHLPDEVSYLLQARSFAAGRLALEPPPVPKAFELYLMDLGPRGWYAVVPPGWSLVLALGVLAGVPWLVNPVLTGCNVLLAYPLLRSLYPRRTSRIALTLFACSPWALFLGMSYMNHTITLTLALLAARGLLEARRTGRMRWAWLGGIALGGMAAVRQLDAMIAALLLGLWALGMAVAHRRPGYLAGLVLGVGAAALPLLAYNRYFTGHPTVFPIMAYTDARVGPKANAYGFGPERGMGWPLDPHPGHGPVDATINSNLNLTALNVELFGWSVGSLGFLYLLLVTGGLRRSDWLMAAAAGGVFVGYYFNYFAGGPDFGARYWYLMLLPLAALSARGVERLGTFLSAPPAPSPRVETRVLAGTGALVLGALAVFVSWRATDKYYHYRNMRPDLVRLAGGWGRSLVVIRGREMPDYAGAAAFNPLDVRAGGPVYVRAPDPETAQALVAAYPDRPIWVVDGPSRTGEGYRVVAGPLDPGAPDTASRLVTP